MKINPHFSDFVTIAMLRFNSLYGTPFDPQVCTYFITVCNKKELLEASDCYCVVLTSF